MAAARGGDPENVCGVSYARHGSGHGLDDGAPSPAGAFLAAYEDTFSPSCGENVAMAGVAVAPTRVGVQGPSPTGAVGAVLGW